MNINGGFVQLQDGGALTTGVDHHRRGHDHAGHPRPQRPGRLTPGGNIVLNGGAGPAAKSSSVGAGLYNSSSTTAAFFAGSTITLGAASSAVNASVGGFGNIDLTNVAIQDSVAGSALNKVGPDTLILSNTNTFTGAFNITRRASSKLPAPTVSAATATNRRGGIRRHDH